MFMRFNLKILLLCSCMRCSCMQCSCMSCKRVRYGVHVSDLILI